MTFDTLVGNFVQVMVLIDRSPPIPKLYSFDLDLPISLGCGGRGKLTLVELRREVPPRA